MYIRSNFDIHRLKLNSINYIVYPDEKMTSVSCRLLEHLAV
jgi:hypothetical protein